MPFWGLGNKDVRKEGWLKQRQSVKLFCLITNKTHGECGVAIIELILGLYIHTEAPLKLLCLMDTAGYDICDAPPWILRETFTYLICYYLLTFEKNFYDFKFKYWIINNLDTTCSKCSMGWFREKQLKAVYEQLRLEQQKIENYLSDWSMKVSAIQIVIYQFVIYIK